MHAVDDPWRYRLRGEFHVIAGTEEHAARARVQPSAQLAADRRRRLPDPSPADHHRAARAARAPRLERDQRARHAAPDRRRGRAGAARPRQARARTGERRARRGPRPSRRRARQHHVDDAALARDDVSGNSRRVHPGQLGADGRALSVRHRRARRSRRPPGRRRLRRDRRARLPPRRRGARGGLHREQPRRGPARCAQCARQRRRRPHALRALAGRGRVAARRRRRDGRRRHPRPTPGRLLGPRHRVARARRAGARSSTSPAIPPRSPATCTRWSLQGRTAWTRSTSSTCFRRRITSKAWSASHEPSAPPIGDLPEPSVTG